MLPNIPAYISNLWRDITSDPWTQDAVRDVSQKLEQLAKDVSNSMSSSTTPSALPAFRAYRNAALTISGTSAQRVPMDKVDFDYVGEFNTTTGRFTPQVTGVYLITAGVGYASSMSAGTLLELQIYKNGSYERYFHYDKLGGSVSPQMNGADLFNVVAGNYYEVYVSGASAGTGVLNDYGATWFSASLVQAAP